MRTGEIDDWKKRTEKEIARNNKFSKDNQAINANYVSLEKKNVELEKQIVHLEQYSRNAKLEIQGVAKTENENTVAVLSMIGNVIREPISECATSRLVITCPCVIRIKLTLSCSL